MGKIRLGDEGGGGDNKRSYLRCSGGKGACGAIEWMGVVYMGGGFRDAGGTGTGRGCRSLWGAAVLVVGGVGIVGGKWGHRSRGMENVGEEGVGGGWEEGIGVLGGESVGIKREWVGDII